MPLNGFTFLTSGGGAAVAYAGELLTLLGADVVHVGLEPAWGDLVTTSLRLADAAALTRLPAAGAIDGAGLLSSLAAPMPYPVVAAPSHADPANDWAASGAMALTGESDGPALDAPGWTGSYLCGAALAARLLTLLTGSNLAIDGAALVGERAAISGLTRQGRVSVGGASRLLQAADGWVVISLTRPEDFEALEAWLGRPWSDRDPWEAIAAQVGSQPAEHTVEFAQLLGIAAAIAAQPEQATSDEQAGARDQSWPPSPWLINGAVPRERQVRQLAGPEAIHPSRHSVRKRAPLVVDLSALWAGPLCTSLLGLAGARVIKVESEARPDGARGGPAVFFDLLNAGKESLVLPLETAEGRAQLGQLLEAADVVVESARPRVMAQWGFDVEEIVGARHDLAWVSITGYGRTGPWQHRVGFGDDTAVAGGFTTSATTGTRDAPCFCADAYADPVSGLHAGVAALAAWVGGGSYLFDIAMREVVGHLLTHYERRASSAVLASDIAPPRARPARGRGPLLGADSLQICSELELTL